MIRRTTEIAFKRARKKKNPFKFRIASSKPKQLRLARRHAKETRFRFYGFSAIATSLIFLLVFFTSIIADGYSAFTQTQIRIPVVFDQVLVEKNNYRKIWQNALKQRFPEAKDRKQRFLVYKLVSKSAAKTLRNKIADNASVIGTKQEIWLPASSLVDMFLKGKTSRDVPEARRKIKDQQIKWLDQLAAGNNIATVFNRQFFSNGDSREPEQAGILGSLTGSFFTITLAVFLSLPIGVGAAVYLEEFAPKNRLTSLIEVNINNLAAVPSIVFGLLALAVYLNFFGMPRSSSLVGGFALSMLVLPTIIIASRNALAGVPPSIGDAATALGATRVQVVLHHTIVYALPGIVTGTTLGVARALGETAPLLMIGMVAFVADVPGSILDPATSLPTQIYLWADSPELGFAEKTSAAIMVLLTILGVVNGFAAYIRRKFEYEW